MHGFVFKHLYLDLDYEVLLSAPPLLVVHVLHKDHLDVSVHLGRIL